MLHVAFLSRAVRPGIGPRILAAGAVVGAGLMAAACAQQGAQPLLGALNSEPPPAADAGKAGKGTNLQTLAAAHKAKPADADAALAYARALRAHDRKGEALAALDAAGAANPKDTRIAAERGLLALDLGQPARAEKLLRQAMDAKNPDWRIVSALGTALATTGRQKEAQAQYSKALALAPDQPSVLNNLALSYALDGKIAEAEQLMRKASRTGKGGPMPQNLALVLGIAGKYDEAQRIAEAAAPATAQANMAYLKTLSAKAGDGAPGPSASLPQPVYRLGGPSGASDRE